MIGRYALSSPSGLVIGLALFFGSTVFADDGAAQDKKRLQGHWQAVEIEVRGKKAPKETLDKIRVQIKGDTFILTTGGLGRESTFELDQKSKPKAIDLTPSQGPEKGNKLPAGIYELDGDKLKLCIAGDPKTSGRPKEFKTAEGGGQTLMLLQRVKE